MIAQNHISRLTAFTERYSSRTLHLPTAEEFLKFLAVAMVVTVLVTGCIREIISLRTPESPVIKVKVQQGDTLWGYASRYSSHYVPKSVDEIVRLNKLERSAAIQPGMELIIPR